MGIIYKEYGGETHFSHEQNAYSRTWTIDSLKSDTKYIVKAYLRNINNNKIIYSEPLDYRTLREDYISNPVFRTIAYSDTFKHAQDLSHFV